MKNVNNCRPSLHLVIIFLLNLFSTWFFFSEDGTDSAGSEKNVLQIPYDATLEAYLTDLHSYKYHAHTLIPIHDERTHNQPDARILVLSLKVQ